MKVGSLRFLGALLLGALVSCTLVQRAAAPKTGGADTGEVAPAVLFAVRVLKTQGAGDLPWSVDLPATCIDCKLEINPITSTQNSKEFYFHFLAPSALHEVAGVPIRVDPTKVRGVLGGPLHVPFQTNAKGITFDAPRPDPRNDDTTERDTYIETPDVRMRIEPADQERHFGRYANGMWPDVERQAARGASSLATTKRSREAFVLKMISLANVCVFS